ncbi:uncharacterized protein LOC123404184 isoform X1 [Hordeum vulgare subsp. vulgare]|nr:uncharacterized protein LOC123404184 isoform X1 [Hordeum vulgare subsp. vulgare]
MFYLPASGCLTSGSGFRHSICSRHPSSGRVLYFRFARCRSMALLMLSCEGFQKHEDRIRATHIGHRLLYSPAADNGYSDDVSAAAAAADDNIIDGCVLSKKNLQNMPDNEDFLSIGGNPVDELKLDDGLGIVERVSPIEYIKRLLLMRSALGDSSIELGINTVMHILPQSSRDCRHTGGLYWHGYYQMNKLCPTVLPPMRYSHCASSNELRCFHKPRAMLQVFCIKLKSYLEDVGGPIEVYGFIAIRDAEDYQRNYVFSRSRDNPIIVNKTSDYLALLSPSRGISMTVDCLMEIDVRAKGPTEDVTLVDGCCDFVESRCVYDTELECTLDGTNGTLIFDLIVFRRALEATIELCFTKVPAGGFELKMCGYTAVSESLYLFAGEQCDCDGFIASPGKHPQRFIAAVPFDDTLFIDFMEGRPPVPFKATVHGCREKEYRFCNGAVVSVKVSWSTSFY